MLISRSASVSWTTGIALARVADIAMVTGYSRSHTAPELPTRRSACGSADLDGRVAEAACENMMPDFSVFAGPNPELATTTWSTLLGLRILSIACYFETVARRFRGGTLPSV